MRGTTIDSKSLDIAVIGMAGRFPGAASLSEFWTHLRNGKELVTFFSDAELESKGISRFAFGDPNYVKAAPVLAGAQDFDADFFGIPPAEAEYMDPQHRVFLECAVEALESSGYDPHRYDGAVGVYAGAGISTYLMSLLRSNSEDLQNSGVVRTMVVVGNDKDYVATRASYKLGLRGPSINVQTACSTSLVAIHLACQSLLTGESDICLAGGVSISNHWGGGYRFVEGGMFSSDGHCRPFDSEANGTVFGDGVGAVVLKRLDQAVTDGDNVLAIIKGSAINNDGSDKIGYMAPSIEGQAAVIAEALAVADVLPESIGYVEAHGTGTTLGDPIEFSALSRAFRTPAGRKPLCHLGSVKANIGHLNAAAGIAGLIKVILAMRHEELPPLANFTRPNPDIDLVNSPFAINTQLVPWRRNGAPRRAGVSSFGVGGTNAHIVLEEPPVMERSAPAARRTHILLLSAKTVSALDKAVLNLARHLRAHSDVNLADVAYTLNVGRTMHRHRCALVCTDVADAIGALESRSRLLLSGTDDAASAARAIFVFPGQGSQYVGMGRDLYEDRSSVFRVEIDRCAALLHSELEVDLRELLYESSNSDNDARDRVNETIFAQPVIFATSYALAKQWMSWGIQPAAMIGHSIGEFVAACLAGVFSLEDALKIVSKRARLMQSCPKGAMLAVAAAPDELHSLLDASHSIAALNAPKSFVVSGTTETIAQLKVDLTARDIVCSLLKTSHAYHSPLMAAAVDPLAETIATFRLAAPRIPYISNVTGAWITELEALDPRYWAKHLLSPVRFAQGIETLLKEPNGVFIEVGAGRALGPLIHQTIGTDKQVRILKSLPHASEADGSANQTILASLAQLALLGVHVDWQRFYAGDARRKVQLPTYPFERRTFVPAALSDPTSIGKTSVDLARSLEDAFQIPSWKRAQPLTPGAIESSATWLVFADEDRFGEAVVERLRAEFRDVTVVTPGTRFEDIDDHRYRISMDNREHYRLLLATLRAAGRSPRYIAYLWSAGISQSVIRAAESSDESLHRAFLGPMYLARGIGESGILGLVTLKFVAAQTQDVIGDDAKNAVATMALGPSIVTPTEYPNVETQFIDLPSRCDDASPALTQRLVDELKGPVTDPVVALRGVRRWTPGYERVRLPAVHPSHGPYRPGGVYLITGGLGDLGLSIARFIAQNFTVKLILVGRTGLPPKSEWAAIASSTEQDRTAHAIRQVLDIEQLGSEVVIAAADVCRLDQMEEVVRTAQMQLGPVMGVIHAAGIAGTGPIGTKDKANAVEVLAPKTVGTAVLNAILGSQELDFVALFSSVNAIHGYPGQVAYAAANLYLDAFARQGGWSRAKRVVSVNWDAWSEIGMAVNTPLPPKLEVLRQRALRYGLRTQEGLEALMRILSASHPQVVVSMRDMNVRSSQKAGAILEIGRRSGAAEEVHDGANREGNQQKRYPRPNMRQAYIAPRTEIEKRVAAIWAALLQLDEVGIEDDFFELGGNSLLGLQLVPRLREAFEVELAQADLFAATTITKLSLLIEDKIVTEIKGMSDEEVRQAIAS